jgi:hypothetical protein
MNLEQFRARTDQKLRFARLHLEEFDSQPSGHGHDFERAHQEAFLSQLLGSYAALLQELNCELECALEPQDVTLGNMRNILKAKNRTSSRLRELYELDLAKSCWLSQAKAMRDHTTHVAGLGLAYHANGEHAGVVVLRDPKLESENISDYKVSLASWLDQMESLIQRFRRDGDKA